uniref:Uncharacterized protein n=1 Tax=Paraburkholderia sprentiae WSM5005 TaxID=754502 RepID=A0A1I9YER3_9BURK
MPRAAIHAENVMSMARACAVVSHVRSAASHHRCALPHQNASRAGCAPTPCDMPRIPATPRSAAH